MKVLILGLMGIIGFEAGEGFERFDPIHVHSGWEGERGYVSEFDAYRGERCLELEPMYPDGGAWVRYLLSEMGEGSIAMGYLQVWILPGSAVDFTLPVSCLMVDGAKLQFYQEPEGSQQIGSVWAEQEVGVEVDTGFRYEAIEDVGAAEWLQVTVMLNYAESLYDVYLNGAPCLMGETMRGEGGQAPGALEIYGSGDWSSLTCLDDLQFTQINPLFVDQDQDGLPDEWEMAHGLNPLVNNRFGDSDGDEVVNQMEFLLGTSPNVDNTLPQPQVVFVNQEVGKDENNGHFSFAGVVPNGPVASVDRGLMLVNSGIMQVASGIYLTENLDITGKDILLQPRGIVRFGVR